MKSEYQTIVVNYILFFQNSYLIFEDAWIFKMWMKIDAIGNDFIFSWWELTRIMKSSWWNDEDADDVVVVVIAVGIFAVVFASNMVF